MREVRHEQIAEFLRARRERLRPELAGLPVGGRRRTPGLRREEVAQLAGVGVTWYTWLEQGRPVNASLSVLEAISRALQLDLNEHAHLLTLAGHVARQKGYRRQAPLDPAVRKVFDALSPMPACVISPCHTVVVSNETSRKLMGDITALPPERRNTMWLLFTEPHWRKLLLDWEREAAHSIALFRGAMAEHAGEPQWEEIVDELLETSEEFREMWAAHHIALSTSRVKSFLHPDIGLIRFTTTPFWLAPMTGMRMITYAPTDEESEEALERLVRSDEPPFSDWSDAARGKHLETSR
jgi:transcriptional regulator with XRE-family HTH domain